MVWTLGPGTGAGVGEGPAACRDRKIAPIVSESAGQVKPGAATSFDEPIGFQEQGFGKRQAEGLRGRS